MHSPRRAATSIGLSRHRVRRAQVAFEAVCNVELVAEWDMTFKRATHLQHTRDEAQCIEVGYLHVVYGMPGGSIVASHTGLQSIKCVSHADHAANPNAASLLPTRSAAAPARSYST